MGDPDFATFSWKEGEAYGRPLQHLQMALITASTAKVAPKVVQDFSRLAKGLLREREAEMTLRKFQSAMREVAKEIDSRNKLRDIPYLQMHPDYVESSVAV